MKDSMQRPGVDNGRAILTEAQVVSIYYDRRKQRVIAKAYGVSRSAIANIKVGNTWGWLTTALYYREFQS